MIKSAGFRQNHDTHENQTDMVTDQIRPPQPDGFSGLSAQAMFEFDPETLTVHWSDIASARRLFSDNSLTDETPLAAFADHALEGDVSKRDATFAGHAQDYSCQYRISTSDEESHWIEDRGGWIDTGQGRKLIGVVRSIDSQRAHEAHLAWLATNDELTGVENRSSLKTKLDDFIETLKKKNEFGAYLIAGIDDVGGVNADFGFEAADQVIKEISQRMVGVLDSADLVGRVAGTKFGILLKRDCHDGIREACIQLLNVVRESVIDTKRGAIAGSICLGAVDLPDDAGSADDAMARAEAALDQAKRMGRSSWSAFNEKTETVSLRRRNTHMSDVILTALNERRVRMAFQPIVTDIGEVPTKYECLIRMVAEDGQNIPAPEFIPVAERLGLVHLLDRRVLELAINTLTQIPNIRLNVNVSMETVKDPVWAEGYLSLMRARENLSRRITVELTETQVIDAIDASIEFVAELKKLGASFAIDDFGAGYTSFRNLKALDIDVLKIDGSFVTGVASSRDNQLFVRTLLDLARNFGMETVAEWVDNEADAMLLKGLGVDYLQGYLLGKPEITPVWLPEGAPNEQLSQRLMR